MKKLWKWMVNIALLMGVLFGTAVGLQAQGWDRDRDGWHDGPGVRREFREHQRDRWRERDDRHRRDRDRWRQRNRRRDRDDFRRHGRERRHWWHHDRHHGRI